LVFIVEIIKGKYMTNEEEKEHNEEMPVLSLNGQITQFQSCEYFKCSMCNQVFKKNEEDPIAHSMLCTGY